MIVIKIERKARIDRTVKKNLIKNRTPTEIKLKISSSGYQNDREEIAYKEEYEVVDVTETENTTATLLVQEIEDEAQFDLARVISAINSLATIGTYGGKIL